MIIVCPSMVWADARGIAMGGTGVASADNLEAPFYNPALTVTEHKSVGLLLPSFSLGVHDGDDLYDNVDNLMDATERLDDDINNVTLQNQWKASLGALDNTQGVVDVGLGLVVAIPTEQVSLNFFTKADAVFIATANIDGADLNLDFNDPACSDTVEDCMNSTVQGLAGVVGDIGIAIARDFYLPTGEKEMRISVGIAPKYQSITAINYETKAAGFDEDDFDFGDDDADTSKLNLDAGVALHPNENVTLGLAVTNVFKHTLDTNIQQGRNDAFIVEAQYTTGISYRTPLFTAALDIDLNERQYFEGLNYGTQFTSIGAEFDAWRWAQLRLGYRHSMNDDSDDVITAGLGFKPFGVLGLDVSGQYGEDNRYALAAQLYFGF
uniref:conjugal transfer protein TraF n=1 Tax=Thaumasiovibrio occultus TaxID=1891184 RepID=UPI00131E2F97|nr:conjugal transfer protein TraF [Thaumasiovibrio occultus]